MCGRPRNPPIKIAAELQRRVTDTLEIAQKMGGMVVVLKGDDIGDALTSFTREYGITHLVLGRPGKKPPMKWFTPSLHDRLIRELTDVDLVIG